WAAAGAIAALLAATAWAALFSAVAQLTAQVDGWLHLVQVLSLVGFVGGWLVAAWNLVRRVRAPGRRGSTTWAALQLAAFTMVLWVALLYHLLGFAAGY
ncbi:MAG: hypothetical protein ABIR54_12400, partial [Burkholderiaceae bacterium]